MSQCVPSWDVEDPPINPSPHRLLPPSSPPHPQLLPMSDYEVAELTWANGQLSAQGLVKPTPRYPTSAAGTLESVVDQANKLLHPLAVVPSNIHHPTGGPVAGTGAVDALVPTRRSLQCDDMASGIEGRKRARVESRDSMAAHCATDNDEFGFGVSGSRDTENTSFGGGGGAAAATGGSKTTMEDHHSACHSRRFLSQMEAGGDENDKVIDGRTLRSTISTKRSTAAAIHNQSERKRRDKINQKMRTLQKLVPNSSKTDKASMLDEVIDYLKQLQAQVQMMSRMSSIPTHPMNMMMPMGMQQYQLTMMAQIAQIAQMGMGLGFMADMGSSLVRPHTGPVGAAAIPQVLQPPSAAAFLPVVGGGSAWEPLNGGVAVMPDSFLSFLACPTQQPMTMDAYQRMAASYQQMFKQNQNSTNPK